MATMSVTTKQSNLNIRSGPSTSYSIVGKLAKGTVIETDGNTVSENGWTWVGYNGNWVCQKDPRYSYAFLIVQAVPEDTTTVTQEEPVETTVNYDDLVSSLLSQFSSDSIDYDEAEAIDGSAVQYGSSRYSTTAGDGDEEYTITKASGYQLTDTGKRRDRKSPEYVQNERGFPPVKRFNSTRGYYEYDYYMDYSEDNLTSDMQSLRQSLNLHIEGRDQLFRQYTEYYNRFKLANPNDALAKSFAHIFFVRPDCNVLVRDGSDFSLVEQLETNANFYYAFMNSPELLRQLTQDAGYDHEFMMYLSNKAGSFSLSDESIETDTYGKAYTGHKVAYGKHDINSKTAGDFSITYTDDRNLHIYQLHKLWVNYISMVYQGKINPRTEMMQNRILDYATCLYYILCAEDGETIIFWSKYYGVFPVSIPSSNFSWSEGNVIGSPSIDIKYMYSWKEDFNPLSLIEFNLNSPDDDYTYVPKHNTSAMWNNSTWVGAPFVETFNDSNLAPYTFKLRFRQGET